MFYLTFYSFFLISRWDADNPILLVPPVHCLFGGLVNCGKGQEKIPKMGRTIITFALLEKLLYSTDIGKYYYPVISLLALRHQLARLWQVWFSDSPQSLNLIEMKIKGVKKVKVKWFGWCIYRHCLQAVQPLMCKLRQRPINPFPDSLIDFARSLLAAENWKSTERIMSMGDSFSAVLPMFTTFLASFSNT